MDHNNFDQKVGYPMPHWCKAHKPTSNSLVGAHCQLEPFTVAASKYEKLLYEALCANNDESSWTYLPYGPFSSFIEFQTWLHKEALGTDHFFYVILDRNAALPLGLIAYSRINPDQGVIEIAHVHFSPLLKRGTAATEAVYLLLREAFEKLGYRRCEWKCNALNEGSKNSALRFGFIHEGCFRQDRVVKGRNRDTDWYSIIDSEWEAVRTRFKKWLDPANFDADGGQKARLSQI